MHRSKLAARDPRPLRRALACLCILTLLSAPLRAQADTPDEMHRDRALAHYQAKDYDGAIAELRQIRKIEQQPPLIYMWAQAERLRGNCEAAVALYRRFLTFDPPEQGKQSALHHLERCERILETAAKARPAPPPPQVVMRDRIYKPWYKDAWGDALTLSGLVASVIGVVLFVRSQSAEEDALAATTHDEYSRRIDDAASQRTLSLVVIGAGAGLLTAGLLRYLLRTPVAETTVSGWVPSMHGAGIQIGGRF